MTRAAVEWRFRADRVWKSLEHTLDNGSCCTAKDIRDVVAAPGLVSGFTPVRSLESNGMSEAVAKTLRRDRVRVAPLPNARTMIGLFDG